MTPQEVPFGGSLGISLPTGYPDRSLALSCLQSFKDMGVSTAPPPPQTFCCPLCPLLSSPCPPQVLEELQSPSGALLQLSQPFQSASSREKLGAFIQQFTQL